MPAEATTSKASKDKKSSHVESKLKVVVRRLPPNLPEAVFWQSVSPWVTDETVSWKTFHQGKLRKGLNKENVPSRAYIAFKTADKLGDFSRAYDGHLFRDKAGNESEAVVEYSPYQKVPPEKKKADPRAGTILEDEDYKSFIASLSQPEPTEAEKRQALVASLAPTPDAPQAIVTPLIASLLAEKASARDREGFHHRTQIERIQREKAEEMTMFRRNPHPAPVSGTVTIAERPRERTASTAGGSASAVKTPVGAPGRPEGLGKKQRPPPPKGPPGSPSKPHKGKQPAVDTASTDSASASTTTVPKPRPPKFKFDAVAGSITPGPPVRPPIPRAAPPAKEEPPNPPSPQVQNEPGTGQSKRAKQRAKAREREREKRLGEADDDVPGDDAAASSSKPAPVPPEPKPSAPKIIQRPMARIDDDDAAVEPGPAGPGIIRVPITVAARGGGRGGGRRGGGHGGGQGSKERNPQLNTP